jgi:uncharacterized protein
LPDPQIAAVIGFAFFAGCVIKGVTGMGMPLVAIAIMSLVLDVQDATPMIMMPALVANVYQVTETRHYRMPIKKLTPIIAGLLIGTYFGVSLAIATDPALMLGVLGVLILGFVILSLFKIDPEAPKRGRNLFGLAAGGFTGFIGSMTGGFGPILAIFLLSLRWPRETYMWAIGVLLLLTASALGLFYALLDAFPAWVFYASFAACGPALLGMWAGGKVRKMVSPERFRSLVLALLAVIAIKHILTTLESL